ncbi:skeletal aspartic acid-rich protein 2-like [Pocillopora damicornis]|uniref:skeletal aspartic acid-rich protein 2-like n=1 Tax=Pocillopora damicornis TaxID=46731 RepID=UPI000F5550D8|nr:skeletal aspartic acid-rich protein 2-like [Pocillopora damicornis]
MTLRLSCVFLLAFAAATLLSAFAADFNDKTCGGMCMKVLRRSGKVLFRRCRNNKAFARAFTVEMDVIKQLGANGKEIGKNRSINPKAQDFTMANLNKSTVLHGLKAMKLSAKAHFKAQKANLHVDIYILCQNGTIKFDDDEIEMKNGSLKLFLKLENYTSSEAKDIELGLIVQGRKGQNPRKDEEIKDSDGKQKKLNRKIPCRKTGKCGKHFRFGSGDDTDDEMSAASKCKVNGKFANFSSGGYPKLEKVRDKYRIAFRVPANLSRSIEIDPGVTLGDELEDEDDKDDKEGNAVSVQLNFLLLFVMLAAIFAFN